jgi:hypothetical protein
VFWDGAGIATRERVIIINMSKTDKTVRWLLFFCAFFVSVGVVEIYLRIAQPDLSTLTGIITASDDPLLLYTLLPGAKVTFCGSLDKIPPTKISISSQGLRDRYYPVRKDPHVIRIAFLGDSFVFGLGVALEDTIPRKLEAMLARKYTGSAVRFEVMNCGVFGYNLIQELQYYKNTIAGFSPDIVLFLISNNDITEAQNLVRHTRKNDFLFRYSWIWRNVYVCGLRKQSQMSPAPELVRTTKAFLEQTQSLCGTYGKIIVVTHASSPRLRDIANTCLSAGIPVVDCCDIYNYRKQIVLSENDPHFNPRGCTLVAGKIYSFLVKSIFTGRFTDKKAVSSIKE